MRPCGSWGFEKLRPRGHGYLRNGDLAGHEELIPRGFGSRDGIWVRNNIITNPKPWALGLKVLHVLSLRLSVDVRGCCKNHQFSAILPFLHGPGSKNVTTFLVFINHCFDTFVEATIIDFPVSPCIEPFPGLQVCKIPSVPTW